MAKFGSFFRRLFSPTSSDEQNLSSPQPPSTSESTSIRIQASATPPRMVTKQTTLNTESISETTSKSNFLSSDIYKSNVRRLSAPLIIQTSANTSLQYPSTIVNETTQEALLSSLQRSSLSSSSTSPAYPNHSIHSLVTSGGSVGGNTGSSFSRPDVRSASFNLSTSPSSLSNNLVNNNSSTSGTPPAQFVGAGQPSSSPRVSVQSNNSPSHNVMKDISPVGETATNNNNSDRKMSLPTRGRRPSMFDPIDPKELQQALYASAAAKASVVPNPADEDDSNRAISQIKIGYDRDAEHVFIDSLSFENMQTFDTFVNNHNHNSNVSTSNNTSSSSGNHNDSIPFYCRFRLWPEKRSLFQTKIVRYPRFQTSYLFDSKQLNDFELSFDQLNNHSIEILIYKVGTTKPSYRDVRIAIVKYDLIGLIEADKISLKKPLDEPDQASLINDPDLGDLLVSLSYLQSAAKLAVVILEAKSLRPLSIESKPYPEACVKVTLFDRNGKKIKRKKTSVQRSSDCPTFNEELVFELRRDIAQEVMIELRIVHEVLSYKEQLGSIIFGPAINNMTKGSVNLENVYWSTILSGESLNAQWQILKTPIRIEESK